MHAECRVVRITPLGHWHPEPYPPGEKSEDSTLDSLILPPPAKEKQKDQHELQLMTAVYPDDPRGKLKFKNPFSIKPMEPRGQYRTATQLSSQLPGLPCTPILAPLQPSEVISKSFKQAGSQ